MRRTLVCQADARHLPLADGSIHLVVTSPPYNARIAYDGYEDWLPWEEYWHGLIEPALRECYRVLAHGGRIALNMANVVRCDVPQPGHSGRPTQYQGRKNLSQNGRKWCPPGANGDTWALMLSPRIWALLEQIGFLPREQLTWIKGGSAEDVTSRSTAWGTFASARNPVLRAVGEPIFIASKGTHSREPGESDITSDEFKAWSRNAWFISASGEDVAGQHPAYFPLELPRRLIKLYSYVGDVVLDPFAGSGTTIRAAKDTQRLGIGVDIGRNYARLATRRCAQELLPLEVP